MKKSCRVTSMAIGATLCNKDGFFDEYVEEELTCSDILELVGNSQDTNIHLILHREFLGRMAKSHMNFIRELRKIINAGEPKPGSFKR